MNLFDDLPGERNHHSSRRYGHHQGHHHDHHYSPGRKHGRGDDYHSLNRFEVLMLHMPPQFRQWLGNKTVIGILLLVALVLLVLVVAGIIYLLPAMLKMFGFIEENGIKSVLDQVAPAANKLWLGSGK